MSQRLRGSDTGYRVKSQNWWGSYAATISKGNAGVGCKMKIVAVLLNVLLLGAVAFIFSKEGMPHGEYWLLFITAVFASVVSTLAILTGKG